MCTTIIVNVQCRCREERTRQSKGGGKRKGECT